MVVVVIFRSGSFVRSCTRFPVVRSFVRSNERADKLKGLGITVSPVILVSRARAGFA